MTKLKDVHIYKKDNVIEIRFEFDNGQNEARAFEIGDDPLKINGDLHALANQVEKSAYNIFLESGKDK